MTTWTRSLLAGWLGAAIAVPALAGTIQLNEIRVDQTGADDDEYIELAGPASASLDGLTVLVIGDGTGGSGVIEEVTDLTGSSIPADGIFLIAEDADTFGAAPDLTTDINMENSDNVTVLLVSGFTGANGDDLDTNDDGTLDVLPWTTVLDAVGIIEEPNPPAGTEYSYGASLGFEDVGPDGSFMPGHIFRCSPQGIWTIGQFDPVDGDDTPGTTNVACGKLPVASISVDKFGPGSAFAGDQITYTLTVSNNGTGNAENVSLIDTLPAGFSFIDENSPMGVTLIDDVEPDIEWSLGTMGSGEIIVVELTVEIDAEASGDATNSASVSTTTKGDNPDDNTDTWVTTITQIVDPPDGLFINEIRIEQPGADNDEYFELQGLPSTSLDGISYLVIGDGDPAAMSGVIEARVDLSGLAIPGDGLFLAVESTFTLAPLFVTDLVTTLDFEGSDNVTHLLVANFTGSLGQDLDTDDDGVIDVMPWTHVLDAVGILEEPNPPAATEYSYGADLGFVDVGPDGEFLPGHIYRCVPDGVWLIGDFDPLAPEASDTPAATNPDDCPMVDPCPADTNGDNLVNVDDLVAVIVAWGTDGSSNNSDVNDDGIVNVDDLVAIVVAWGMCPE